MPIVIYSSKFKYEEIKSNKVIKRVRSTYITFLNAVVTKNKGSIILLL